MHLIVQLIALALHDPKDTGSGNAIVKLRRLQQEFIQREIVDNRVPSKFLCPRSLRGYHTF